MYGREGEGGGGVLKRWRQLSTPEKPLMEWGLLERRRFKRGLSDQSGVVILAGAKASPTDSSGD